MSWKRSVCLETVCAKKRSLIHFHNKPAAKSKPAKKLKTHSLPSVLMDSSNWILLMKLLWHSNYKRGSGKKWKHYSSFLFVCLIVLHKEYSLNCLMSLQLPSQLFAINPRLDFLWFLSIRQDWAAASGTIKYWQLFVLLACQVSYLWQQHLDATAHLITCALS